MKTILINTHAEFVQAVKTFPIVPFGTPENSCIFDDITKFLSKFLTGFFNDGLREKTFDKNIVISRF